MPTGLSLASVAHQPATATLKDAKAPAAAPIWLARQWRLLLLYMVILLIFVNLFKVHDEKINFYALGNFDLAYFHIYAVWL